MIIRDILPQDKETFNKLANHPLQAYEWGEFRELTGIKTIRKGVFEGKKLITPIQITIHSIPKLNWNLGYFPKGPMPDEVQLEVLGKVGEENRCIFIKLEPNVKRSNAAGTIDQFLNQRGVKKGRPLFTRYSFELDLKPTEPELLAKMHPKTRYNLNLAAKKGVKVKEDNSDNAFNWFLKLLFEETTKRQGFYSHTPEYYKKLWSVLKPAGIAKILRADWGGKTLACFMVFVFNQKIYYPYGASTREHKELMAPNLLMWEAIRLGKKLGCQSFDMWGSLGPKPDPTDPWFGFHRFKQGYGGELTEFLGSYDLVLNPTIYQLYRIAEEGRWAILRTKAQLKKIPYRLKTGGQKLINDLATVFEGK